MLRKLDSSLDVWIRSSHRKPLVLFGARGVGKTALLQSLAQRTDRALVHIDFSRSPQACETFKQQEDPHRIVRTLEALTHQRIDPTHSILFLDEIQACDEALASLRRFKADAPEFPVAAAGSSLGVHLARGPQAVLPIEHVGTETVRPLDFEEFCDALGEAQAYAIAAECFERAEPCPLHETLMGLYREYLLVGGMPDAVERYRTARQMEDVRAAQQSIRDLYALTMVQDCEGVDPTKIMAAWRSVPEQLAKPTGSTKFLWKRIARGAKAERYSTAVDWLAQANMLNLCTQVSGGAGGGSHAAASRLDVLENPTAFKAYVADTGLLSRAYEAQLSDYLVAREEQAGQGGATGSDSKAAASYRRALFRTGVAENFVMQELVAADVRPHYWGMQSKHEAQFVAELDDGIVPITVVAGARGRDRATGSRDFARRYGSPYAIQVSEDQQRTRTSGGVTVRSIPPYAVGLAIA